MNMKVLKLYIFGIGSSIATVVFPYSSVENLGLQESISLEI